MLDTIKTSAPFLPPDSPLAMPQQVLFEPFDARDDPGTGPRSVGWRRLFVFGLAAVLTGLSAWQMYEVLAVGGLTTLEGAVLVVFSLLNGWLSLSLASSLGGLISMASGGHSGLEAPGEGPLPALGIRVAVLMPTYNEDPWRVFGGLEATYRSLAECGALASFDFFVLSDTTDGDIWVREEALILALRTRLNADANLFYRRRPLNTDRKAGNIADWVTRFGAGYEAMLVLDADSVMRGETIVRLAGALEAAPKAGLIQTLPALVGGKTIYARAQSFAGRLYGPMIAQGIAWWHGAESNFWGHNAIIRVRAFAQSAGLPHLSGPKPFGGHILSHDFVEAALLRRAGWGVHMLPALEGSYEEGPPTLSDNAVRDRRWAQGNLQHARLLCASGLHPVSRLHLLFGIASYLSSPLLLVLVLLGLGLAVQAQFLVPDYFPKGLSLFPLWPAQDPVRAVAVFSGTMAILFIPKGAALLVTLAQGACAARFGGRSKLLRSFFVETILSALTAPIAMLDQTKAVISILLRRDSGWNPQQRDERALAWAGLVRAYWGYTLLGIAMAFASFAITPTLVLWMLPIWIGLVLAIPLARLASQPCRGGLMAAPEDLAPPHELVLADQARSDLRALDDGNRPGIALLMANPALLFAHLAALPDLGERAAGDHRPERLVARAKITDAPTLAQACAELSQKETVAALSDRVCLERLMALG